MLRPSKKLALALEAVVDVARHGTLGPVQSQDIAVRLDLPRRYLEQVMQQLVRAGVLVGVRGPRGGYRLARGPESISAGEVVRILQGEPDEDTYSAKLARTRIGRELVGPMFEHATRQLLERLDTVTIAQLVAGHGPAAVASGERPPKASAAA